MHFREVHPGLSVCALLTSVWKSFGLDCDGVSCYHVSGPGQLIKAAVRVVCAAPQQPSLQQHAGQCPAG